MQYTLGQAAIATGKAKSTLQRAIDKGRFSAKKDDKGHYSIDPSELHRVYQPVATKHTKETGTQDDTHPMQQSNKISELEVKLQVKDDKITFYEKHIEELKEEKNQWREQAQKLLIENKQEQKPHQEQYNTSSGRHGHKSKNNALATTLLGVTAILLTVLLTYITKSFWLPFLN